MGKRCRQVKIKLNKNATKDAVNYVIFHGRYDGMEKEDIIKEVLEDLAQIHNRSLEFVKNRYR
jgi:hypothetical protein